MPIRRQSIALALAAAVACLSVFAASAQSANDPVLAKVNGVEIRESDLALAEADIGQSLPPGAAEARRDALLSYLIDVTILATAAEQQKLQEAPSFARKLGFVRNKVLMEALLDQATKGGVTEEAMRKLYEESVSKLTPEEEVRARHILVDSEDKAKEVIAKLKAGGDFAALAKEYSKDPGAAEGGDLGYFSQGSDGRRVRRRRLQDEGGRHLRSGEDPVRLARDQARGPAVEAGADVRAGQGPDRAVSCAQGAVGPGPEAARIR